MATKIVAAGDMLPSIEVDEGKPGQTVNVRELFKGKRGILFGVPGAFTPTCSEKHLPGFVSDYSTLESAGFGVIACVSVNDAFVMDAWGKQQACGGKIRMLADKCGRLARALGLELPQTKEPLGNCRCKRFAMIVDDGKILKVNLEKEAMAPTVIEDLKALQSKL
eukprot:gnl/MRDRNA2_/MRDRNA2_28272_c0_seq1.p1 gnl/MRDRNA2_/MRDRNA2_28272_c0~~gnl/MRDRNA2_/MRDRNA2_28272_c0_seq1.p1  ORF type:complete len:188 (+),score=40.45 gnl/MRDRNA2_/MRDRNA2_28272_c0_seq1:71-565(+)